MTRSFENHPMQNSETQELLARICTIIEQEARMESARSGGPGGQNVNKRSTKAVLIWNVRRSDGLSSDEKMLLEPYLTRNGELIVHCQDERSFDQNKNIAYARMAAKVAGILEPVTERKATKPTKGSKAERREGKAHQAAKKAERKNYRHGDDE